MQCHLYSEGGACASGQQTGGTSRRPGAGLLASATPGMAHPSSGSCFWTVRGLKARSPAGCGESLRGRAATGVRLLVADLQPAGTPDPAGQGAGPAVPLPHPGYRQRRRESVSRGCIRHTGASSLEEPRHGQVLGLRDLQGPFQRKPVVAQFLGRWQTQGTLLPRPRGSQRQCCPCAFTGKGGRFVRTARAPTGPMGS